MKALSLRVVDNKTGTDVSIVINEQPLQLAPLSTLNGATAIDLGADFVKIGSNGQVLPDSATDHA